MIIGKTILHYKILEKLGEGGMGVVYKAEDTKLQRIVAIKFLPQDLTRNAEAKQRFIHEARAASALDHPNICTIHEFNETEDGQLFMVMAYYDEQSLKEKIASGPLNPEEAIDITIQVAEGLKKAHSKDIIHRDIKPSNIMITSDGIVKIVDFGLAKLVSGERLTVDGKTMGTVAYMSPEQTYGEDVDRRTDIWSLGVVMYEMLTGKLPFQGEYEQAIIYSIVNEEPEPMSDLVTEIPFELEQFVGAALKKKRDERYQQATDILDDIRSTVLGLEPTKLKTKSIKSKTKRSFIYGSIAALILLIAAVSFYFFLGRKTAIPRIAVLPFKSIAESPAQEWFTDGMTSELYATVGKISGIRVVSLSSTMQYKDNRPAMTEIAAALNVDFVIEGSVSLFGDSVRIYPNLVNAREDARVWGEIYNRSLENALIVQSEITREIINQVKVVLTPEENQRLTNARPIDPDAYEAYLKGLYYAKRVEHRTSIDYFQQAIRLEPNYAEAYARLAVAYTGTFGTSAENEQKAKTAIRKALVLDSTLSEAHASLGYINLFVDRDWNGAEKSFRRAIQLNQNNEGALQWYSLYLTAMDRHKEAIATIKKASRLDPLNPGISALVGLHYYYARDYDRAIEEVKKTLEFHPQFFMAHYFMGAFLVAKQDYPQALTRLQKALELHYDPDILSWIGMTHALAGRRNEAVKILNELIARSKNELVPSGVLTHVYIGLGDFDKAFEYLNKSLKEPNTGSILLLKVAPWLDPLRSDVRFKELLKKVGLDD